MFLALTLEVSKFLPLLLDLLEQGLARLGSVFHPKKYLLIDKQVPDLPSIVSKTRNLSNAFNDTDWQARKRTKPRWRVSNEA
jgi:hypothetical protein